MYLPFVLFHILSARFSTCHFHPVWFPSFLSCTSFSLFLLNWEKQHLQLSFSGMLFFFLFICVFCHNLVTNVCILQLQVNASVIQPLSVFLLAGDLTVLKKKQKKNMSNVWPNSCRIKHGPTDINHEQCVVFSLFFPDAWLRKWQTKNKKNWTMFPWILLLFSNFSRFHQITSYSSFFVFKPQICAEELMNICPLASLKQYFSTFTS